MTIKLIGWQLDTCGCYIIEQYDTADPTLTKTVQSVPKKCTAHTATLDQNIYTVVRDENSRWAVTPQIIIDNGPSTLYDVQTDGSRQFKQNISVNWSWSGTAPNRVLTVTITGVTLNNTQKTTIQNIFNTKFGTGKVVLA